jgi:hypothetical protein
MTRKRPARPVAEHPVAISVPLQTRQKAHFVTAITRLERTISALQNGGDELQFMAIVRKSRVFATLAA